MSKRILNASEKMSNALSWHRLFVRVKMKENKTVTSITHLKGSLDPRKSKCKSVKSRVKMPTSINNACTAVWNAPLKPFSPFKMQQRVQSAFFLLSRVLQKPRNSHSGVHNVLVRCSILSKHVTYLARPSYLDRLLNRSKMIWKTYTQTPTHNIF